VIQDIIISVEGGIFMITKEIKEEPKLDHYNDEETCSVFGLELLRSVLIPELLGRENSGVSYWAGKNIARKYPLTSTEEIIDFFKKASWGDLQLVKESKTEMIFELTSPLITKRFKQETNPISYQLEAGFIAEQIQRMTNYITEAYTSEKNGKDPFVLFEVKWDRKDLVNNI
jgi:predicted hydrocarbon binding protein